AQSVEVTSEFEYWQRLAKEGITRVQADYPEGENLEKDSVSIQVSLDEERTNALLKEVPKVLHNEINHSLLAALTKAFEKVTGESRLFIEMEGHGREDIFGDLDLSRTIGWFTSIFPVLLDSEGVTGVKETVDKVKEQLQQIPGKGIGYGILKYLTKIEEIRTGMKMIPHAEIAFNYLGQFDNNANDDSTIIPAQEAKGPERGPSNKRPYLIEITSGIMKGRLTVEWVFSAKQFNSKTIQNLADAYIYEIQKIVDFVKLQSIDFKANEFSEFGWDQQELDKILSVLNGSKE
ncbi:MAG: condensation domain-containing protein, partial [Ignavibacteriales bacterium]